VTKSGYQELEVCRAEARGTESGGEVPVRGQPAPRLYEERCKLPASLVHACCRLKVSPFCSFHGDFSRHCNVAFFPFAAGSLSSSFLEFISIVTPTKEVMFSSPFVCLFAC